MSSTIFSMHHEFHVTTQHLLALVEAKKAGAVLAYGNFITILINFIILAFVIFQMVKMVNRMKKTVPAAPAATPDDIVLLREIRDALKK